MSVLHVQQISGYLKEKLSDYLDMSDWETHHRESDHVEKAFLTRGLSVLAVSKLAGISLEDMSPYVTDGTGDGGIDLIYFDQKEKTLYLQQSKWHSSGHGSLDVGDVLKFLDGVSKVLDNKISTLNKKIQARQADIERALYDANAKFVLVISSTGVEELSEDVLSKIREYIEEKNDTSELMSFEFFDQGRLHKAVAENRSGAPVSIDVQLFGWGHIREPHKAFYGRVCAADIAVWFGQYGGKLFDDNLRQFLGGSIVNQDIVNTLVQRPDDFWYFNNGITAIADVVEKKPIGGNSTDSGIFECVGFRIVNGAQTVGSIHASWGEYAASIDKAMVSVRILSSANENENFVYEVTRYTNTQNAIEKRDFVALDPEQERIRQELSINGIEYAFKSGSKIVNKHKGFDLTEATIALACVYAEIELAVQAKREIGKLWENIKRAPYKQLFNSGVLGPSIWEMVKILREIESILEQEVTKRFEKEKLICIHGNRFIQWAVFQALNVNMKSSYSIIQSEILDQTMVVIDKVIQEVKINHPDSYPASIFKNSTKCRQIAASFREVGAAGSQAYLPF